MRVFRLLVLALFLIWPARLVMAQSQHTNQARGFKPDAVYSTHDVDSVNLFNGNLNVSIPVGGTYPVGSNLSYAFHLTYNSSLWTGTEVASDAGTALNYDLFGGWTMQGRLFNGYTCGQWRYVYFGIEPLISTGPDPYPNRSRDDGYFTVNDPNPNANAGMGWQLSLGRLFAPRPDAMSWHPMMTEAFTWVYQSPDGSEHGFYPCLHAGDQPEGCDADPATAAVTYTRDGTYLRMKVVGSDRDVEFPSGEVHRFQNFGTAAAPDWRVIQMRDQFGNRLDVSYNITRDGGGKITQETWTLTDTIEKEGTIQRRTHTFNLSRLTNDFQPVITSVNLAAFGEQTAVYTFEYETRTIRRAAPSVPDHPLFNPYITVPFLKGVRLPDGSRYSMPVDASYDLLGDRSSQHSIGIMTGMTLPTGAQLEWDYKPAEPPADNLDGYTYPRYSAGRDYARRNTGVRVRRARVGGGVHETRYDPRSGPLPPGCIPSSPSPDCAIRSFTNKMTTPQGDYKMQHFSVYPFPLDTTTGRDIMAWHVAEYGLPLVKDNYILDATGQPLFLSEEVYEKQADSSYLKVRSTYVRYETDQLRQRDPWGGAVSTNRRLAARRVVYPDDGGKFAEVRYSQFDGLGHYRRVDTSGNFGAGDVRSERVNYNPARGTYFIDPWTNAPGAGHTYSPPPADQPWVLGTYDMQAIIEANASSRADYFFDQYGLLLRKRLRRLTGTGATLPGTSSRDVVFKYEYQNGNLTGERSFGGDKNLLAADDPAITTCEYHVQHSYQHGVLRASQFKDCYGNALAGANFKSYDSDIDFSTGLVKTTRDTAGEQVNYVYDSRGRLTSSKPRQGSLMQIIYTRQGGTLPNGQVAASATVNLYKKSNNGASILDEEKYEYDGLGRLTVESKKMPGDGFISRQTLYNNMGWTASVSEWGNFAEKTQYLNYDPFGRSQWVRLPDDVGTTVQHDIRLEYKGVREVERRVRIGTSYSAGTTTETDATTVETYDRQGRLSSVRENSDDALGKAVTTAYLYDIGGRLKQVQTTADVPVPRVNVALAANGGRIQEVSSSYDANRYPPASAINGERRGVGWGAGGGGWNDATPGAYPDWIVVAFSGSKAIDEIDVFTLQDDTANPVEPTQAMTFALYGITDYLVQYWNQSLNGGAGGWANVPNGSVTANNKVWRQFKFAPITTDKIRVYVRGSLQNFSRVVEVEAYEVAAAAVTSVTQTRTFTYDNRGFLLSETHPELGASGNGAVTFGNYDSRGNMGSEVDGGNTLRYGYDAAGRNVTIEEKLPPVGGVDQYRFLKQFYYYGDQSGGVSLGKLRQAVRHNYVTNGGSPTDITVSEDYFYSGQDGNLSQRNTSTSTGASFSQSFTYTQLGLLASQGYPQCTNAACTGGGAEVVKARTVSNQYTNGHLIRVFSGTLNYASSIGYHTNGTLNTVAHGNGVTDVHEMDPDAMQRPRRISTTGADVNWNSGIYRFDGAGNITRIGADWYTYDRVGRLAEGTALSVGKKKSHTYDPFGNITAVRTYDNVGTTSERLVWNNQLGVSPQTNRLAGKPYDAAGNLLGQSGTTAAFAYDALNMIKQAPGKTFIYTAGDERIVIRDEGTTSVETFVLRGLGSEVLREYQLIGANAVGNWSWRRDYVYRGDKLLSAETPQGKVDFHLDHLGTPRMITDSAARRVSIHQYFPFGEEATQPSDANGILKFTGHERDTFYTGEQLDYMHARYYGAGHGKFLSVDPGRDFDPQQPQSWNLYAYVRNNPVNATDPTGRQGSTQAAYNAIFDPPSHLDAILAVVPANMRADARKHVPYVLDAAAAEGLNREELAYALATMQVESEMGGALYERYNGNPYNYFENKYGHTTTKGQELGNTQPGDGFAYRGTGYAHLTGRGQYERLSGLIGLDLVANPAAAADPRVAAKILVTGSLYGQFTGHGLGRYINSTKNDFKGARRVINGQDRASIVAGFARNYLAALNQSQW